MTQRAQTPIAVWASERGESEGTVVHLRLQCTALGLPLATDVPFVLESAEGPFRLEIRRPKDDDRTPQIDANERFEAVLANVSEDVFIRSPYDQVFLSLSREEWPDGWVEPDTWVRYQEDALVFHFNGFDGMGSVPAIRFWPKRVASFFEAKKED